METHLSESSGSQAQEKKNRTQEDYDKELELLKTRISLLETENKRLRADVDFIFSKFPVFKTKEMYDVIPSLALFDHNDVVGKTNLLNPSHFETIINWFHVTYGLSKLILKYQATRDSFEKKSFRSHINHQGPPLMFFFKAKGHHDIFGAYTTAVIGDHKGKDGNNILGAQDRHAFLFNLTQSKKYPSRDPEDMGLDTEEHNIVFEDGLITFGPRDCPDLHIGDNANKEESSSCNFSNYFKDEHNVLERKECPNLIAGSKKFILEEIEVFVVIASPYHL